MLSSFCQLVPDNRRTKTHLYINRCDTEKRLIKNISFELEVNKMKLKPCYLIFHFSPWQMSNGKLSHHVEKRPEIILSAHFLVGNNKSKTCIHVTQFKTNTPGEGGVGGGDSHIEVQILKQCIISYQSVFFCSIP